VTARRHVVLVLLALLPAGVSLSGQPPRDSVPAAGGAITIVPFAHATLQILHRDTVILIDPALDGALPAPPAPPGAPAPPPPPPPLPGTVRTKRYEGRVKPTLVLVTHLHDDHFAAEALAFVRTPTTKVVGPIGLNAVAPGAIILANGASRSVDGVGIEAVPMYNLRRGARPGRLFHVRGQGNGYVLTVGGTRLYVAGDTECTPEMKAMTRIDVAFLPMNLPFTMPPAEAADCAQAFKPAIVYPYHYAGQDTRLFDGAVKGSGSEVRLRNWYPPIR
jgi:L-ascorbate metabolism protein UlaG (beta-lactamase superfamily)